MKSIFFSPFFSSSLNSAGLNFENSKPLFFIYTARPVFVTKTTTIRIASWIVSRRRRTPGISGERQLNVDERGANVDETNAEARGRCMPLSGVAAHESAARSEAA